MSRTSRVPYHQNVYDLLSIEPGECPRAAVMIAAHEAKHGPLPASLREWYLQPNMVPIEIPDDVEPHEFGAGTLWHDYLPHDMGNRYHVRALREVLSNWDRTRRRGAGASADVLSTWGYYTWTWAVMPDGTDDPPVWVTADALDPRAEPSKQQAASFSEFLSDQFAEFYEKGTSDFVDGHCGADPAHANGLWLRTPAEPFEPAVIDFLCEQLGEPERTPRPGDVTTFTFRLPDGILRVTADAPTHAAGLSAWWLHADTPERLAELARLVLPFGTLRDTLRADTEPARAVLALIGCGRGS